MRGPRICNDTRGIVDTETERVSGFVDGIQNRRRRVRLTHRIGYSRKRPRGGVHVDERAEPVIEPEHVGTEKNRIIRRHARRNPDLKELAAPDRGVVDSHFQNVAGKCTLGNMGVRADHKRLVGHLIQGSEPRQAMNELIVEIEPSRTFGIQGKRGMVPDIRRD